MKIEYCFFFLTRRKMPLQCWRQNVKWTGGNVIETLSFPLSRKHCLPKTKNEDIGYYTFESFCFRTVRLSIQKDIEHLLPKETRGKHCDSSNVLYVERDGYQEFALYKGMFGLM